MRARIIITDDKGRTLEGEIELTSGAAVRTGKRRAEPRKGKKSAALDFEMPVRAFVKRHVRNLSGPKKFVLLLAWFAKGQDGKEIALKDVERHWNKMTSVSLMGGKFNRFYSNIARENGWVHTTKPGVYFLRPSWKEILQ